MSETARQPAPAPEAPTRFLRRRSWLCRAAGACLAAACAGVVLVALLCHWPRVNLAMVYVTVIPPLAWFAAVAGMIAVSVVGVRTRWVLCAGLLWLVGLFAVEDVAQWLRAQPDRARAEFRDARMAFRSRPSGNPARSEARVPLRVATWNVYHTRERPEAAVAQLVALEPDIALLQEVNPERLRAAVHALDSEEPWHLGIAHGTAVLSRFPLTPVPAGVLRPWRGSIWRVRVAPDAELTCLTVHMKRSILQPYLVKHPHDRRALADAVEGTERRFADLRAALEEHGARGAVVLGGDFNLPPRFPAVRRATRGFVDCFGEAGFGWGKTVPARLPMLRVDMIYVPRGARVYYAAALPTDHSDHRMVLAEVAVPLSPLKPPKRED